MPTGWEADIPDDLIEIHDPEVDPGRIMAEIRERIRRARQTAGLPAFLSFGPVELPAEPDGDAYDAQLYYHLRRANELYGRLEVEPVLAPSPLTRVPVLGRVWGRLRREAHNLVVFYLNRLAGQQLAVNRHLVAVLNRMAARLQEQERQIRVLEEEIRRLRGEG